MGARNFLIAYNVNLDSADVNIAKNIACEIRESGSNIKTYDEKGNIVDLHIPGTLKNVKAIGWYLPEYNKVQVSVNITDINTTPVYKVFEEIRDKAGKHGISVTGSELIGLIPIAAMLDTGNFYSGKYETDLPDETKLKIAVDNLGLNDLAPFDYKSRILEFAIAEI